MSSNVDIEKFGENLSDDELVELIRSGKEEESVLGALNELSRRKSSRQLDVFRRVLDDPALSSRAKKTAAARLSNQPLKESQELLTRHLITGDAALFARIAQSLGKIGDEKSLARLEATKPPDEKVAPRALQFAKTLLTYRLRLDRHLLGTPSPDDLVKVTKGISFKAEAVDRETLTRAITQAKKDLPAVPLASDRGVKLTCRSTELLLLMAAEFVEPPALKTILERPALPLVLLKRGLSLDRWSLDRYLFTHPSKGGKQAALLGTRPSGELTYAGIVQPSERGFSFSLKTVDTRYAAAIEVEGSYDVEKRELELTKATSDEEIAARRRKPFQPQRAAPRSAGRR
jgi:hypothetical protein